MLHTEYRRRSSFIGVGAEVRRCHAKRAECQLTVRAERLDDRHAGKRIRGTVPRLVAVQTAELQTVDRTVRTDQRARAAGAARRREAHGAIRGTEYLFVRQGTRGRQAQTQVVHVCPPERIERNAMQRARSRCRLQASSGDVAGRERGGAQGHRSSRRQGDGRRADRQQRTRRVELPASVHVVDTRRAKIGGCGEQDVGDLRRGEIRPARLHQRCRRRDRRRRERGAAAGDPAIAGAAGGHDDADPGSDQEEITRVARTIGETRDLVRPVDRPHRDELTVGPGFARITSGPIGIRQATIAGGHDDQLPRGNGLLEPGFGDRAGGGERHVEDRRTPDAVGDAGVDRIGAGRGGVEHADRQHAWIEQIAAGVARLCDHRCDRCAVPADVGGVGRAAKHFIAGPAQASRKHDVARVHAGVQHAHRSAPGVGLLHAARQPQAAARLSQRIAAGLQTEQHRARQRCARADDRSIAPDNRECVANTLRELATRKTFAGAARRANNAR